jgi:hypothetical protein
VASELLEFPECRDHLELGLVGDVLVVEAVVEPDRPQHPEFVLGEPAARVAHRPHPTLLDVLEAGAVVDDVAPLIVPGEAVEQGVHRQVTTFVVLVHRGPLDAFRVSPIFVLAVGAEGGDLEVLAVHVGDPHAERLALLEIPHALPVEHGGDLTGLGVGGQVHVLGIELHPLVLGDEEITDTATHEIDFVAAISEDVVETGHLWRHGDVTLKELRHSLPPDGGAA